MKLSRFWASLEQGGIMVAKVESTDKEQCEREINHYAMMYSQDGPFSIKRNYKEP